MGAGGAGTPTWISPPNRTDAALLRHAPGQEEPVAARAAGAAGGVGGARVVAPVDVAAHRAEDRAARVLRDQEPPPRDHARLGRRLRVEPDRRAQRDVPAI